ncbi:MAG: hypothetical protein IIA17_02575 [candidate division Zixibacteria bacterium]|nr:hypothetical protein [candidate division Zixibacteria bacterium]
MHKNKIAVQEKIFDPKLELSLQAGIETGKELLKTSRRIEKKLHIQNELATLLIQKPNKRILNLVRFNLWVYNKANKGLEKRFKWWLKNKVGEPPVILNKNDIIKTARPILSAASKQSENC